MTLLLEPHSQEKQKRQRRVREHLGNAGEAGGKQGNRRPARRNICTAFLCEEKKAEFCLHSPPETQHKHGGAAFHSFVFRTLSAGLFSPSPFPFLANNFPSPTAPPPPCLPSNKPWPLAPWVEAHPGLGGVEQLRFTLPVMDGQENSESQSSIPPFTVGGEGGGGIPQRRCNHYMFDTKCCDLDPNPRSAPGGPGSFLGGFYSQRRRGTNAFHKKHRKKGRKTCLEAQKLRVGHQIPHAGFRYGVWM